jgi:hypothetical protein
VKKKYEVRFDAVTRKIHIRYAGWSFVGTATTPQEALHKAERWLHNKFAGERGE